MKKRIFLPLLFLGLLTLASCKGKTETSQSTSEPAQTEKQTTGPIHLTKAEFLKKIADYETNSKEWKYLGDKPAIVDFYADWCGPCKMVAPLLESLSKEYEGKINVYKIDVDKEQELARAFGIQSIPTLWFIPMKGEPQVAMGALSKEQLDEYIKQVLLK